MFDASVWLIPGIRHQNVDIQNKPASFIQKERAKDIKRWYILDGEFGINSLNQFEPCATRWEEVLKMLKLRLATYQQALS
jgi:hypothetical protein